MKSNRVFVMARDILNVAKEIEDTSVGSTTLMCLPGYYEEDREREPRESQGHGVQGDAVNHPPHYNFGKIEVIEFIEDQDLDHHRSTAIKYICRAGRKYGARPIEDLEKAVWYLQRKIEIQTASQEGKTPRRPNEMGKK